MQGGQHEYEDFDDDIKLKGRVPTRQPSEYEAPVTSPNRKNRDVRYSQGPYHTSKNIHVPRPSNNTAVRMNGEAVYNNTFESLADQVYDLPPESDVTNLVYDVPPDSNPNKEYDEILEPEATNEEYCEIDDPPSLAIAPEYQVVPDDLMKMPSPNKVSSLRKKAPPPQTNFNPFEEYETPFDAQKKSRTFTATETERGVPWDVQRKIRTLTSPPVSDYETPIDASI